MSQRDTIAAIATAPGAGGVGIVRLSGPAARAIGEAICTRGLTARYAHHVRFRAGDGDTLADGIVLYFAGPARYTQTEERSVGEEGVRTVRYRGSPYR